jgi:hypothetical protein
MFAQEDYSRRARARVEPQAQRITRVLGEKWYNKDGTASYGIVSCPCHDDRHASLRLKDGPNGLVVECYAGCDWRAVRDRLREMRLLRRPGQMAPRVQ